VTGVTVIEITDAVVIGTAMTEERIRLRAIGGLVDPNKLILIATGHRTTVIPAAIATVVTVTEEKAAATDSMTVVATEIVIGVAMTTAIEVVVRTISTEDRIKISVLVSENATVPTDTSLRATASNAMAKGSGTQAAGTAAGATAVAATWTATGRVTAATVTATTTDTETPATWTRAIGDVMAAVRDRAMEVTDHHRHVTWLTGQRHVTGLTGLHHVTELTGRVIAVLSMQIGVAVRMTRRPVHLLVASWNDNDHHREVEIRRTTAPGRNRRPTATDRRTAARRSDRD
jgi:hypothetical protein